MFSIQLHSQSNKIDTVYQLSEVNISAGRLNDFSTGLNITNIDSVVIERHRTSSLSKLLAEQTPLYIKSYGQGSLATISFRGTSASQTGFFWNGFAIDPPNIAIVDLSLIPVFFFGSIKIQNGGTSSLYGSGNIGGSIHLNNLPIFSKYTGI
ncbi:MAG: Plug domain-containing protein, partial [Bacteroidales bacterium]|nr:Plug domain-containing protein [Bacteroidales bacterium]